MVEKEDSVIGDVETETAEIDAILAELADVTGDTEGDAEYPLPEKKPVKFTDVDVVIMPKGYKSEYPKPEDSKPRFEDSLPSMKIDIDSAEEAEGVLSVPVTVANAGHIYDYDGLKVHKPFEELEAASKFCDSRPITREHPLARIVTDRAEVLGFFKTPLANDDVLKGVLQITDKDLIADVKAKKLTDVSPGFFCDLDRSASGDLNGEHYDATQRNIFIDHIAVCENGRCSIEDGCGIGLDATPVPQALMDKLMNAIDRAKAMKDKSLLNMLEAIRKELSVGKKEEEKEEKGDKKMVDNEEVKEEEKKKKEDKDGPTVPQLKAVVKAVKGELNELKSKINEVVKSEKEAVIKELETLQDSKKRSDFESLSLDELKKELDMVKTLKAKRLSVPDSSRTSGRTSIDDAYNKIGI